LPEIRGVRAPGIEAEAENLANRPRVRVFVRMEPMIYENGVTDFWRDLEALIIEHGGRQPTDD